MCKWFAYGPADATAAAIIFCFIKIEIGFTFLLLAYPGCSGKETVKLVSHALLLLTVCQDFAHKNLLFIPVSFGN